MKRTQIYLTKDEWQILNKTRHQRKTTMAFLIREAVDTVYLAPSHAKFLKAFERAKGLWQHRTDLPSTYEYVRRLRDHDRPVPPPSE